MAKMNTYATFDLYLADQAPENQEVIRALRSFVKKAAPNLEESVKWGNGCWLKGKVPVAYVYSDKGFVQFGFMLGSALDDPRKLLQGSAQHVRHIKVRDVKDIDTKAFGALLRQAVEVTPDSFAELRATAGRSAAKRSKAPSERTKQPARKTSKESARVAKKAPAKRVAASPKLLAGGNPQIAKGNGDAPVQAYIAAMPGWKREVGRSLDALIARTVPNVRKAVRWNSPFYGIEGQGWFLGVHCITKYVKVAFFRGSALRPLPPVESKQKDVRYFHIHEGDQLDEKLVASWIRQAAKLPGDDCF